MKPHKHNDVMSTQRTRELKKSVQAVEREISTVRGRIFTEVFSRNEEKPLIVKRALAYRTVLENLPIRIYNDELIKKHTGVTNDMIVSNAHKLVENGHQVVFRIPRAVRCLRKIHFHHLK